MTPHRLTGMLAASLAGLLILSPRSALPGEALSAEPTATNSGTFEEAVDKVVKADTSLKSKLAYQALLKRMKPGDFERLSNSVHDGLALQLAWSKVLSRTFARRQPGEGTGREIKLDRRELSRFVGFLEGRLRVSVPPWWEKVVLSAKAGKRPDLVCDFVVARHAPHHKTPYGPWALLQTDVLKRDNRIVFLVGDDSVSMKRSVVKGFFRDDPPGPGPSLSATLCPDDWYLVTFSSMGESVSTITLRRIDRESGRSIWKTSVSTNHEVVVHNMLLRKGQRPGDHSMAIMVRDEQVLVFGAESSSIYVQGFRRADGKNLFRFSTDY